MSEPPTGDGKPDQAEDPTPKTPEEIYAYFAAMSVGELEALADGSVAALAAARDRSEAEQTVVRLAPFFLDCTYPRISPDRQAALRDSLDRAEEKFGSLARVLGFDEAFAEKPEPLAVEEAIGLLLRHDLTPPERRQAARWVCGFSGAAYGKLPARVRNKLKQAIARFELRWGDLETLANGE